MVLGLAVVGIYAWALRGHFVSDRMLLPAQIISITVLVTAAIYTALTVFWVQPLWAQVVGVVIELAGLWVFFAAVRASRAARLRFAFDPARPETLVEDGPYGVVRHPFYVSYLIFWAGWALATWSIWSVIPFVVILGLYIYAARFEERNFAGSGLSTAYEDYRRRVGFFLPKF